MSPFRGLRRIWADRRRVGRWWAVGVGFTFLNIPVLYSLVEILAVPLAIATVVAGEAGLLVRFLVNDRWVFNEQRPTWGRLGQYHVAVGGGFLIWWSATNFFSAWGVHYLVASLLATGISVAWSMFTNFLWVWRHQPVPEGAVAGTERPASGSR